MSALWAASPSSIRHLIFVLLNAAYIFETYVSWRQHRQISQPGVPKQLAAFCSKEEHAKSRGYLLDCSRFALLKNLYDHVLAVLLLFSGFMPWLWAWCGQMLAPWTGTSEIPQSLLYTAVTVAANTASNLPLSIYQTFFLEKRHGFNKTTVRVFVTDILKSLILTAVLGGPILAALLWVIHRTGRLFFISAYVLMLVVQMVMIVIFPTVIQPWFNKFTPLAEGDLREKIKQLASRVDFPLTKIFVIDGSTRSSHSNAYFFGLFKNKRIVIYDTLLEQMSSEEICAVIGHELGHWARNHMLKGLLFTQANIFLNFLLFSLFIEYRPLYEAFGFTSQPTLIGLTLFTQLVTPLTLAMVFVVNWMSRSREFEADRYAVDLGYGKSLASGLVKLYTKNKSLMHPDWLYSTMNYTHPPLSERIEAMEKYSKQEEKKKY